MVMVIYPEEFTDLSICIRTAARIIADDIGEWKGEIFSDIDVSPFRRNGGKKLGLVMFTAHEYAHLEPIGKMKIACEAIEAAMVRAVELNQIKALQLSRHLSGEIKPEQTFLGLTDIFKWCEVNLPLLDVPLSRSFMRPSIAVLRASFSQTALD